MRVVKLFPLGEKVRKTVYLKGSKSITNRALLIASLAEGESRLINYSQSDDSQTIVEFLRKLGAKIFESEGVLVVNPIKDKLPLKVDFEHNVGPAGTAARFLTAYSACFCKGLILDGSERMRERPMKPLFEALESLGAEFRYFNKPYKLPFKVIKTVDFTKKSEVEVLGSVSSQFITALLLISPFFDKFTLKIKDKLVSSSYVNITLNVMKAFGVKVENRENKVFVLQESNYLGREYFIEGDASGASYLWGIAAVTGSRIGVGNLSVDSIQADVKFADVLENMGCKVYKNRANKIIEVEGRPLLPVKVDFENMPDVAQTLSVICSFVKGKSVITGLSTLKHKETDRLQALKNELTKIGVGADIGDDWIKINSSGLPKPARIKTYKDHRMAMSFAVAGVKIGIEIEEPEVVKKSFPDFWRILEKLGVKLEFFEV